MVAEKPSIARDIYSAISNQKPQNQKGGNTILKFGGKFFQHNAYYTVTAVKGHVFQRDFPSYCKNWEKIDPLDLFEINTEKESCDNGQTKKMLQNLGEGIDIICLWLDNDREGENISFEILDIVCKKMQKNSFRQIYRVKFSSLVKRDLIQAFQNVSEGPNLSEALAVESRQIFDLKIGVAFTRFITLNLKNEFAKLKDKLISYGPCQIPTLCLIYQRDKEIKNFKPEKYYQIQYQIQFNDHQTQKIDVSIKNNKNHFSEKSQATMFYDQLIKQGKLINIKQFNSKKVRPKGLNTVDMLKFATKYLGFSSHDAMKCAERLYLSGYVTYPRTESTHYPNNFNFNNVLSKIGEGNSQLSQYAKNLIQQGINKPLKGNDAGDHPPIAPTGQIPSNLDFQQQRIYDFIVSNFIQSVSEDAIISKTEYLFQFGDYQFSFENSTTKKLGYLSVKGKSLNDQNLLINYSPKVNEDVILHRNLIVDKMTTPPNDMTESELLGKMEKFHIGTDASMAVHVKNVIERAYVEVENQTRKMKTTDLGLSLIESLYQIDPQIVEPQLRGNVEQQMDQIANGQKQFEEITISILQQFKTKFIYFKNNFGKLVDNLKNYYQSSEEVLKNGKLFGRCGKCNLFLSYSDSLKKITCTKCMDWVFEFPNTIIQLTNDSCMIDKYPLYRYKLMLGLNQQEEEQLYDQNIEDKKELIAKTRNFAVYIRCCSYCGFLKQSQNQKYFGSDLLVQKCQLCNFKTYLAEDKSSNILYQICENFQCYNLKELITDVNNYRILDDKCSCGNFKLNITQKNSPSIDTCICQLKGQDLGVHCNYEKLKKFKETGRRGGGRGRGRGRGGRGKRKN